MTKEFANYKQSMALKELGFNEPCFFAFDNCSTPMRCSDLRTSEQKFNGVNYNSSTYVSQPLKSQIFKWFREKHDLHFPIMIQHSIWYFDRFSTKGYKTYEEAEDACIDKLIEIIKK